MKKSIVSRTIKTALASLLAIIVSQELSLEFAAAAGIIAILNVFDTRKSYDRRWTEENFVCSDCSFDWRVLI